MIKTEARRVFLGVALAPAALNVDCTLKRSRPDQNGKEELFREAIALYEDEEGGFATHALAEEPTARSALERMFREAIDVYSRPGKPRGCMVASAATNCATGNDAVMRWLAERRRTRTKSIIDRLRRAVKQGEFDPGADVVALGDYFAALLHGLSVQARDGVPRKRLFALIATALQALPQSRSAPRRHSRGSRRVE